jgi:hypothetical protein
VNSRTTKSFLEQFERLPEEVQKQAKRSYILWKNNPYHGSLQFKRVSRRQPIYSVRLGLGWRVLGLLEADTVYWFWVGSHAAYDDFLTRL